MLLCPVDILGNIVINPPGTAGLATTNVVGFFERRRRNIDDADIAAFFADSYNLLRLSYGFKRTGQTTQN
jgi:hypothetical protein